MDTNKKLIIGGISVAVLGISSFLFFRWRKNKNVIDSDKSGDLDGGFTTPTVLIPSDLSFTVSDQSISRNNTNNTSNTSKVIDNSATMKRAIKIPIT